MEPVRLEIAPEVNLDYVRSDKFKTGTLSVQLICLLYTSPSPRDA